MSDKKDEKPDSKNQDGARKENQVLLDLLENAGFFQQINVLQESLNVITGELKSFGEGTIKRMEETENLATHVLAIESILSVMLKTYPISADELDAEIRDRTAATSGNAEGSSTVQALAQSILEKGKG